MDEIRELDRVDANRGFFGRIFGVGRSNVERKRQQVYSKLVVSLVFLVLAKCDLQQRQVGELRNSLTEQQENIIHLQQSLDSQTNRLLEYYEALNTASPSNLSYVDQQVDEVTSQWLSEDYATSISK